MNCMKSFRPHQRLLIFLLIALALTCALSPWLALGADWLSGHWPAFVSERVPFSRIFNRAFMISAIILFIAGRRLLIPDQLKEILAVRSSVAAKNLQLGAALALGSMVFLIVTMTVADVYTPFFRLSLADSLSRFASALASGVFVGFLEEIFFRGMLFLSLCNQGRPLRAYVLANLFYSLLHFVKPGASYFLDHLDPTAGFRHLLTTFEPFLEPIPLLPGIFGLFLIGVVLSYALARTGNLYLSIGLHGGWVIGLKTIRVFGDFTRQDLGWAFGSTDPKIVSGVVTWIGILLVGFAVHWFTRKGSRSLADRSRAAAA
jgi:membrane protease YdiL (CAAX protease family)